jgi:hypothetical protein
LYDGIQALSNNIKYEKAKPRSKAGLYDG